MPNINWEVLFQVFVVPSAMDLAAVRRALLRVADRSHRPKALIVMKTVPRRFYAEHRVVHTPVHNRPTSKTNALVRQAPPTSMLPMSIRNKFAPPCENSFKTSSRRNAIEMIALVCRVRDIVD